MRKRILSLALLAALGMGVAPAFVPVTATAAAQRYDRHERYERNDRYHRWHWHHRGFLGLAFARNA